MGSIKNQIFKDFEVWIMDGNSSIETQNYLNKLEAPFFYHSQKDKGIYGFHLHQWGTSLFQVRSEDQIVHPLHVLTLLLKMKIKHLGLEYSLFYQLQQKEE